MRLWRLFLAVLFLIGISPAAELRLRVVDPQNAAVANAEVVVLGSGETTVGVGRTSARGESVFQVTDGNYRVRVLAPSFAVSEEELQVSGNAQRTIQLRLASAVETVNVTANGVPASGEDSGAQVATLSRDELQAMQPVMASDALRFLPGAIVNTVGRRGGQGTLFVRGGESRYNKVIVDGVPVNDPGGIFDFGVVPLPQAQRIELLKGAQSTLYGSDAMTSVVQVFSEEGHSRAPELSLGAEGGTFQTARGYAALAGAYRAWDYDVFGEQTNTQGQGVNDAYSNSSEGANLGVALSPVVQFRLRARHANSFTGVSSEWNFNGLPLLPPDQDQRTRTNALLAGADLTLTGMAHWRHDFRGFEYSLRRRNIDTVQEPGRTTPAFGNIDFPFNFLSDINRAGFAYEGEYWPRGWARSTFGYEFEDENGFIGDLTSPPSTHGLRRNHAVYGQEILKWRRVSLVGGARYVHNESFGSKVVPRVAASYSLLEGGRLFSGTRLHAAYATGILAPALDQSFATSYSIANPNLKAEENRSLEAGLTQRLFGGAAAFTGNFFDNRFHNQIAFSCCDQNFLGQFVNVNRELARGVELELSARLKSRFSLEVGYTNLSTKILQAPLTTNPLLQAGKPLLHRPKHSGSLMLNYAARRWGGNAGLAFVGRRPDSDFLGLLIQGQSIDHAAGYARTDIAAWYDVTRRVTAYVKVENALNKHYEEVTGYPALGANFRAGMRFRIGGE
jgi:outer membrane cobalamin receptor